MATAVVLFGFQSGAALPIVVGVLIEVPIMLSVVRFVRHSVGWYGANPLDRAFETSAPNQKWIADFTYIWTAEGWLYVAAVVDLFSRLVASHL